MLQLFPNRSRRDLKLKVRPSMNYLAKTKSITVRLMAISVQKGRKVQYGTDK